MVIMQTTERHPVRTAYSVPQWLESEQSGQTHIYPDAEYVGTTTFIRRVNQTYFSVCTRQTPGAFGPATPDAQWAHIWWAKLENQWVIDYNERGQSVEVSRTRGLDGALSVAVWNTSERGRNAGWW